MITVDKRITQAVDLLHTFKQGDHVRVEARGEKSYDMYVSRTAHRSDGAFGSYESNRITVTFGPGRYAREVTAEQIASGDVTIERSY